MQGKTCFEFERDYFLITNTFVHVICIKRRVGLNVRIILGYGISQWEEALLCNTFSHWPSVYTEQFPKLLRQWKGLFNNCFKCEITGVKMIIYGVVIEPPSWNSTRKTFKMFAKVIYMILEITFFYASALTLVKYKRDVQQVKVFRKS